MSQPGHLKGQYEFVALLLEDILPFSLILNSSRQILKFGKSLNKLLKARAAEGLVFEDLFRPGTSPSDFILNGPELTFRSKALSFGDGHMLFCLAPRFNDPLGITQIGLIYSDFSVLDPIIDYVIIYQSMQMTEKDLKESHTALNSKVARLNFYSELTAMCSQTLEREWLLKDVLLHFLRFLQTSSGLILNRGLTEFSGESGVCIPAVETRPDLSEMVARWGLMAADRSSDHRPSANFLGKVQNNATGEFQFGFIFRSSVGAEFDLLLVLDVPESNLFISTDQKLIQDALILVGSALDQKELARRVEENRVHLVASSKMAALGEMAGGVAHEINNPLTIILGKIAKLERTLASAPLEPDLIRQELQAVKSMSDRIHKIVQGLKVFSRDGSQDGLELISIRKILDETLELCSERMSAFSIELKLNCGHDVEVRCRPVQISQVLMNLVINSKDAVVSKHDKWIEIETRVENGHLVIAVIDSGEGISGEVASRLMQPFFTTKAPGQGTGLGLSISKGIVESHGGQLRYIAESKNTRFEFSLPVIQK